MMGLENAKYKVGDKVCMIGMFNDKEGWVPVSRTRLEITNVRLSKDERRIVYCFNGYPPMYESSVFATHAEAKEECWQRNLHIHRDV